MENNDYHSQHIDFLKDSLSLLNKIHNIQLIAINDVFFDEHLEYLTSNEIIRDTIKVSKH